MAIANADMSMNLNEIKLFDSMAHWCDERNLNFRKQYVINCQGISGPPEIVVFRDNYVSVISFYDGEAGATLLALFLCDHSRRLRLANPDFKIAVTYIVSSMPLPEVCEFANEMGVGFCLRSNALDRMESLTL